MTIAFRCSCGAAYDLRDEFAGRMLHCPRCGRAQQIGGAAKVPTIDAAMLAGEPSPSAEMPAPLNPALAPPPSQVLTITDDMLAAAPPLPEPVVPSDGRVDFEKGMPLAPPLTLILIAANVIVFFITLGKGALESKEAIILAGALSRDHVFGSAGGAPELWRLVSAMFLHGGFDHLFANCVALYVLGMACEHAYGLARTAVLYMLAGIGASVVSLTFSPGPSVGASGAIFGLMGAGIIFFRRHGNRFILRDNRVGVVLMVWAGYTILTGLAQPYVDNGAHVGGLIFGSLLALAARPAILDRIPALGPKS